MRPKCNRDLPGATRREGDAYMTPAEDVHRLLDRKPVHTDLPIIDPTCGHGSILRVLADRGVKYLYGNDINAQLLRQAEVFVPEAFLMLGDYLELDVSVFGDHPAQMLSNFPFNLAEDMLMYTVLHRVVPEATLLLPLDFLGSRGRVPFFQPGFGFHQLYVMPNRPCFAIKVRCPHCPYEEWFEPTHTPPFTHPPMGWVPKVDGLDWKVWDALYGKDGEDAF